MHNNNNIFFFIIRSLIYIERKLVSAKKNDNACEWKVLQVFSKFIPQLIIYFSLLLISLIGNKVQHTAEYSVIVCYCEPKWVFY